MILVEMSFLEKKISKMQQILSEQKTKTMKLKSHFCQKPKLRCLES